MIILPAQLSELTGSSQANSTGSSVANSSPGSTQQDKQATRIQSTMGKTKQYDEMTICYAGCDAGCKMQDMTGNAWTWPQLGKPSVPLDRGDEIAWKRYKDHWNRSYGLEMANVLRYDTGLRFAASRHLNATKWTCYSHQTWKQNTWQWCTQDGWQNTSTEP